VIMDTDTEPQNTDIIMANIGKTCKVSQKSLSNLKPWVKGQNPNPGNIGKKVPKVYAKARHDLIKILEEQLTLNVPQTSLDKIKEFYPKTSSKTTAGEAVMMRLLLAAVSGEAWAIKEILERFNGKVTLPIKQDIKIGPKIDDLTDDELDQAIKNTAINVDAGAGTPALPE
jgi:hypothetical protein